MRFTGMLVREKFILQTKMCTFIYSTTNMLMSRMRVLSATYTLKLNYLSQNFIKII